MLPNQIKVIQPIKDGYLFGQIVRVRLRQRCQLLEKKQECQEKWVKEYVNEYVKKSNGTTKDNITLHHTIVLPNNRSYEQDN